VHLTTKISVSNVAENTFKKVPGITDTNIATAYENYCRYRWYLRQYSKSIADTIGSNKNTLILITLMLTMFFLYHTVIKRGALTLCSEFLQVLFCMIAFFVIGKMITTRISLDCVCDGHHVSHWATVIPSAVIQGFCQSLKLLKSVLFNSSICNDIERECLKVT